MTLYQTLLYLLVAVSAGALAGSQPTASAADRTLIAWDRYASDLMKPQSAQVERAQEEGQAVLRIATKDDANWPGVTLPVPDAHWDLSAFRNIVVSLRNIESTPVTINCRVDSQDNDDKTMSITEHTTLQPGESKELVVTLKPILPNELTEKLYGMRGYPGGYTKDKGLDTAHISQLIIFVNKPTQPHRFQIGVIRATGTAPAAKVYRLPADKFFPMIDPLGQFIHADWPGKAQDAGALKSDIRLQQAELDAHPAPANWNKYGGWKDGPQLKATGFFYPTQRNGKWWLVDPAGQLFWSHGVDCVGYSQGATPITDREFYYQELPAADSPFAQFYGRGSWAPHGYYQDKGTYRTYNFAATNLQRKYGNDWKERTAETIHARLRSWAMNSIGNWSDSTVYAMRKTPYVVSAGSGGAKPIEGSTGYWGKFPDPFDASFRQALDRRMRGQRDRSAGDPWCIGYFVDNELAWGDEYSLATATLASPPEQAAKKVFLSDLQEKYSSISQLNQAWGTDHKSWNELAECRTAPDEKRAADDLGIFYTKIAEQYFRHCREAVKAVAPNNLYLGCRFAWVNDRGAKAAAKFCDVIGYNLYRDNVDDFQLPVGVDMPVIIGEFHFGALDRGMFHTGLRPTNSQPARAQAYRDYVSGALKNRYLVGSHWFQYADQATTGRGDGENYQIGLINVCDRPYPETIQAVREIGASMYQLRAEAK